MSVAQRAADGELGHRPWGRWPVWPGSPDGAGCSRGGAQLFWASQVNPSVAVPPWVVLGASLLTV